MPVRAVPDKAIVLGGSVHLTLRSLDGSLRVRAVVTKRFFERAEISPDQMLLLERPKNRVLTF